MTTYEVLRKIASGGNATVYAARAVSLGITRTVALKKPHPHLLDDPAFEEAFRREAAVAVRVRHPNVVQVLDVIEHEGVPTLVLELVEGPTLAVLVRSWVSSGTDASTSHVGAAIKIVADAARGLHALHEQRDESGALLGLVHRDVSPQNVLVDASGIAKLSDFGLAKQTASGDHSTTEGILKGKVGYLSPEYIRGEPVDRRSDVFALGIVLWESLAKKRLFRSEREPDVLGKILGMAIPALELAPRSTAAALDRVVARALARDVRERFATALEVAEALENAAIELGLDATPSAVARVVSLLGKDPKPSTTSPPPAVGPDAKRATSSPAPAATSAERTTADDVPTTRDLVAPSSLVMLSEGPPVKATATTTEESVPARTAGTAGTTGTTGTATSGRRARVVAGLVLATGTALAVGAYLRITSTPVERGEPVGASVLSSEESGPTSSAEVPSTSSPSTTSSATSSASPSTSTKLVSTPSAVTSSASSTRPPTKALPTAKPGPRPNPYAKDAGK